jgi:stage III sporulation protein SpoIIIAA
LSTPTHELALSAVDPELGALLERLPDDVVRSLLALPDLPHLLELVMDLGRVPEARFAEREVLLGEREVTLEALDEVIARVGAFGEDNRAGIERTLHRISALRNRKGRVIGLTIRVGRAVFGTMKVIRDLVESGRSILLLGRPGVGKTTMLREVSRVLADELKKRVIVVDTSNEIAGDGDIPHPGIGRARRMQVASPALQHAVMIEAVENHMPEVIVIDEIGTELEAQAARTIAERGVQLIGTAHGRTLDNLLLNPTLSDLIGGIQTVTLSDEEARRRGTQKSVLERKAPPTFDVVVELESRERVAILEDVASTVDAVLRGVAISPKVRALDAQGEVHEERPAPRVVALEGGGSQVAGQGPREPRGRGPRREDGGERRRRPERDEGARSMDAERARVPTRRLRLFSCGMSERRLERAARELGLPVELVALPELAEAMICTRDAQRDHRASVRTAETARIPVHVIEDASLPAVRRCLSQLYGLAENGEAVAAAIREAEEAIDRVNAGAEAVHLAPQSAAVRKLQHQLVERHRLASRSEGREPHRHVTVSG